MSSSVENDLIWPADPSAAFALMCCQSVPLDDSSDDDEDTKKAPQTEEELHEAMSKAAQKRSEQTEEEQKSSSPLDLLVGARRKVKETQPPELDVEAPPMSTEERVRRSKAKFRLASNSSVVRVGEEVQLHLELSSVAELVASSSSSRPSSCPMMCSLSFDDLFPENLIQISSFYAQKKHVNTLSKEKRT